MCENYYLVDHEVTLPPPGPHGVLGEGSYWGPEGAVHQVAAGAQEQEV